ncbi:MAG: recombinase family protein [Lachnospiraceae bacterium]|nr:recombinase family protein [Lachnospiraceae bacterium]
MARKSRKNSSAETAKVSVIKTWQAALYVRLSVEFNGNRGDSLETQRQIMEAYIALFPDIEIVDVYTDNGTTGRTFERPAFQQMLCDVDAGKINCIVVKDLSRLGRNAIDTGYYIEKYFPLHGVRFIAVNDQFDSEDSDNSGSHLIVPLKNMINEAYAADISRKVRSQLHQAMQEGQFVGGRPPYGYLKDPHDCHKLVVNPETAPVVRQIFEWAADSVALNRIALNLNEGKILSPGFYMMSIGLITNKKLAGSGVWQTRTVTNILNDEVYVGDMVQGKTKSIGQKQVRTEPDEWIIMQNAHEAIISRELFAQAHEGRKRMSEAYTRPVSAPYSENILKGKIFCGHCGTPLHRHRQGDGYVYYCLTNYRVGKGACSGNVSVTEAQLFQTILAFIRKKAEVVLGQRLYIKQGDSKITARKAAVEGEISELGRQTQKNKDLLASLYENHVKGVLTRAEYLEMQEDYSKKIAAAVDCVQRLQQEQSDLERQVERCASIADKLENLDKNVVLSAQLINMLIERITVNSPNDISVQFTFEDDFDRIREVLGNE